MAIRERCILFRISNANIKSILFIPQGSYVKPTKKEDYIIKDLIEIKNILNVSRETFNI